jgi:acetyl esterase/lipase
VLRDLPNRTNIALICPDYRLAPQTSLPIILEDAVSSIDFVRSRLPSMLNDVIDPSRLAISGSSAGGWLALLTGVPGSLGSVIPPPTCVVSFCPLTDIDSTFYRTPQRPPSYLKEM